MKFTIQLFYYYFYFYNCQYLHEIFKTSEILRPLSQGKHNGYLQPRLQLPYSGLNVELSADKTTQK